VGVEEIELERAVAVQRRALDLLADRDFFRRGLAWA
jgi:hypothetical protein